MSQEPETPDDSAIQRLLRSAGPSSSHVQMHSLVARAVAEGRLPAEAAAKVLADFVADSEERLRSRLASDVDAGRISAERAAKFLAAP